MTKPETVNYKNNELKFALGLYKEGIMSLDRLFREIKKQFPSGIIVEDCIEFQNFRP